MYFSTYSEPATGEPTPPKMTWRPLPTAYVAISSAFSENHSGLSADGGQARDVVAQAARRATTSARTVRMRELSTQQPMCRTGGMPIVSQTSASDSPANSIVSGVSRPCLPLVMAAQPVTTTSTLLAMSSRTTLTTA